MEKAYFQELVELTKEDRRAIFEYAMKRSEEIIRGIDETESRERETSLDRSLSLNTK